MMKLYIYDHCPYCVKARMIFGLKGIPIKLKTLLNDDEKTPISMIGVKMVPILEYKPDNFMPESLDIISYIDNSKAPQLVKDKGNSKLTHWLDKNSLLCYKLAMPRWVKVDLEEFKTQKAKDYFINKKINYIGDFEEALRESEKLIQQMTKELNTLEKLFEKKQSFFAGALSWDDFHLFAFLRSLSIVKDLNFPPKVRFYSEKLSQKSQTPLHHSLAL